MNIEQWRNQLAQHGVVYLKILIIVWSIIVIVIALLVDNPWILAGIFLYEALP